MQDVTLTHAKEHLEELIERASRGEEVRIAAPAIGTVRLQVVPEEVSTAPTRSRVPGRLIGKIPPPPDDFFDPLSEEELKLWYGDDP